ncbi:dTDP-4-keto-6-deoxy-D-glucose epimerase [Micromonospora sp. HNM0581]|nr:dTDP-4-keto-6-deoxy-D-glucose epimerase [Micromonospora sp. HNM0581]
MSSTMQARALKVEGAVEFTPRVFPDDRGIFVSPFQETAFVEALGHPLFPVAQTNHSRSRKGVVRGAHFTLTPPGIAKYVYCARGKTIDFVVDIRVGSPTFGQFDQVLLDQEAFRAVYLPVGVAHAFAALADDTVVSYMLSDGYVEAHEKAVNVLDPALNLPLPTGVERVLSDRDRSAPTIEEARRLGLLPDYAQCQKLESELFAAPRGRE